MTATDYRKILDWCDTYTPSTWTGPDTATEELDYRVKYLDAMLTKHCEVNGYPCDSAALSVDENWIPGIWNENGAGRRRHWVVQPWSTPKLRDEIWRAAVGAFKNHALIEEQSCRV